MLHKTPTRLGIRIRELRTAAHLTQRQLAKRAFVSDSYISQLETGGRQNCSLDVVEHLARALDYPLETLLKEGGVIPEIQMSDRKQELIEKLAEAGEQLPERVLESEIERLEIQAEYYRRQRASGANGQA